MPHQSWEKRSLRDTLIFRLSLMSQLPACGTGVWYGTMQSLAKQSCQHQPPPELAACEEPRYKEDFETYEKQRENY